MEFVLFTAVAVAAYAAATFLVDALERRVGRRFEYRSVLFFAILLALALLAFSAVRQIVGA